MRSWGAPRRRLLRRRPPAHTQAPAGGDRKRRLSAEALAPSSSSAPAGMQQPPAAKQARLLHMLDALRSQAQLGGTAAPHAGRPQRTETARTVRCRAHSLAVGPAHQPAVVSAPSILDRLPDSLTGLPPSPAAARLPASPACCRVQTQQLLCCALAETGTSLNGGLAALDKAGSMLLGASGSADGVTTDDALAAAEAALLHTTKHMAQAKLLLLQQLVRAAAQRRAAAAAGTGDAELQDTGSSTSAALPC